MTGYFSDCRTTMVRSDSYVTRTTFEFFPQKMGCALDDQTNRKETTPSNTNNWLSWRQQKNRATVFFFEKQTPSQRNSFRFTSTSLPIRIKIFATRTMSKQVLLKILRAAYLTLLTYTVSASPSRSSGLHSCLWIEWSLRKLEALLKAEMWVSSRELLSLRSVCRKWQLVKVLQC